MTQTVLYYPTISIPNTDWLRQSLFYFDKIASIAPRMVWDPDKEKVFVPLTPELEYLQHEGVYEPLDPESLTGETLPLDAGKVLGVGLTLSAERKRPVAGLYARARRKLKPVSGSVCSPAKPKLLLAPLVARTAPKAA